MKYNALCETCKGTMKYIKYIDTKNGSDNTYYVYYSCDNCKKNYEYSLRKGPSYYIPKSFYATYNVKCPSCKKKIDFVYCSYPQESDMKFSFKCEYCHKQNVFNEIMIE